MPRPLLAAALCLGLAACSMPQLAATATNAALSADTVARLASVCRGGQTIVAIAAGPAMPASVKEIATFVGAYCGQLTAGTVPATTDANTVSWLQQNIAALRALVG